MKEEWLSSTLQEQHALIFLDLVCDWQPECCRASMLCCQLLRTFTSINLCSCEPIDYVSQLNLHLYIFLIEPLRYFKHLAFVISWSRRGESVAAPRREAGRANPLGTVSVPNCSFGFQGCSDVDQCWDHKVLRFILITRSKLIQNQKTNQGRAGTESTQHHEMLHHRVVRMCLRSLVGNNPGYDNSPSSIKVLTGAFNVT